VRRVWLLSAVLLAPTLRASPQTPQTTQPPQLPTFRGGTNIVQVDAIVADARGQPIVDLVAADFEVLDDGRPMSIDRVRFLGAAAYSGDTTLAPIRTHEDEEREASRDDVRVYAIVLDDYHVTRMGELRVIEPLLAFVRQLSPTDLVAVYYPLDPVTDVSFSRDRQPVLKAISGFYGRRGDYTPKHPVEEEHLRNQRDIEQIRRRITTSALEGLATHLGGIKQGRKSIIFVSEGFTQPVDELRNVYEAANRANVAIYPVDPRGLTTGSERGTSADQMRNMMNMLVADRDAMRALALETGGRAFVQRNDIAAALDQVLRDASAYYLIAYESPHPDDGKFHRVTVHVKRTGATLLARGGYWGFTRGENTVSAASAVAPVLPAVQAAVDRLADSLRPDADEPAEGRHRVNMARPPDTRRADLLAPPTIGMARGRAVGDPVSRREFRRTDTIVIRAVTMRTAAVSGRLLDRRGQPLTDLAVSPAAESCELRLALGNLGPGDYVIELCARAGDESAQQYVAFRVLR
jgi:VWFA-related protein